MADPKEQKKQDGLPEVRLPNSVDSGDIVLFNRKCSSMSPYGAGICFVAKFFSNSKWDHVGIVVRDPESKELFFLEADLGGVKLRKLTDRVQKSKSHDIAIRRLSIMRTDDFRLRLWNFAQEMTGRPYETGTGLLQAAHAVFDPLTNQERERLHALLLEKKEQFADIERELDNAVLTAFHRRTLLAERKRVQRNIELLSARINEVIQSEPVRTKRQRKEDDLARVFCSELIAAAYQRLQLLEAYPKADSYTPRDFSSEPSASLRLLDRARLSRELYLKRSDKVFGEFVDRSRQTVETGQSPSSENLAVLRKVFKRTPVANDIPDIYKRNEFLKSFRSVVVEPGDIIFEQGEYGNKFYILESGAVDRFIAKENGRPVLVTSLGPHTSFGLSAFLFNMPRTSTMRARERSVIWVIDRPTFEGFCDERDASQILSSAEQRQLRKILEDHFLFRSLDRIGPRELGTFFKIQFRAGEEIFHQGDAHDNFYILKSGECERHISHPRSGGSDGAGGRPEGAGSLAKTILPGEAFGELGLMYNSKRSATIRARTDVECWAINAETFHRLHLGGGAKYLQAIFQKNASVERDGKLLLTADDFLRFARVDTFPEEDRERLSKLLVSLVTSNRKRNDESGVNEEMLIDFWEFVRFDIVLNQPDCVEEFAFRLADRNNSGFIDADELMSLLTEYKDIDKEASEMLSSFQFLSNLFGRDGSRVISYKEYCKLPIKTILPKQFRQDVHLLAEHMLMNLEANTNSIEETEFVNLADGYVYGSNKDMKKEILKQLDVLHILTVGISAAVARTLVAPLERLKILMQTDQLGPNRKYHGFWKGLNTMFTRETSINGLFRGNVANVVRIIPTAMIQLSLLGVLQYTLDNGKADAEDGETEVDDLKGTEVKPNPTSRKIAIAGTAGMVAAFALYPLEFIRGRLTVQHSGFSPYHGIFHGLRSSVEKHGLLSVYRGVGPSLLGVFPYVGVSYATYDQLRAYFPKKSDGSGLPTASSAIICGSIASITAQTLAFPLDTCRRRMQTNQFLPNTNPNVRPRLGQVVQELWKTEGIYGFYRGVTPNIVKAIPSTVVALYMYDFVRTRLLIERNLWMKNESSLM